LAKREEQRLQRPVIPVFWIAGEDHDVNEVNHIWMLHEKGKLMKHRYPTSHTGKRSVSSILLQRKRVVRWLDELSQVIPDSEYKKEWLQVFKHNVTDSVSWTRYFARIMHHLFGRWGLLLIDSNDPQLRRMESPFFGKLIEREQQVNQHVIHASEQLGNLGYPSPVEIDKRQTNLFIEVEGERHLFYNYGSFWMSKNGVHRFTKQQIKEICQDSPERLSNNVITRPLMQEYLFPTLLFVGGPSEIAYWGLLKQAFREMNLQMPIVYPRTSFTLLDRRTQLRLQQFDLSIHDLFANLEKKKAEWLENQRPEGLDRLFVQVEEQVEAIYHPLIKELNQKIGMDIELIGQKNLQEIKKQIHYLQKEVDKKMLMKYETDLRRWDELIHTVLPRKIPQERVLNLIHFWNLYGMDWLERMIEEVSIDFENTHVLVIM
jgi:bacillithiol synthase